MGKQDRVAGAAGLVDAELAAHDIGAQLGHPAQRGRLAAGDRDEALDAVPLLVIERLERARQLAAGGRTGGADQRSRRRPGRAPRRVRSAGISFDALGVHALDVVLGHR